MSQFWKTIDQKYFGEASEDLPDLDLWRRDTKSESDHEIVNNHQNNSNGAFVTEELALLVGSIFNSQAFDVDGNINKSKSNFMNYMLSLNTTLSSYGLLMKIVNAGILPCEKCLNNLSQLMEKNYHKLLDQFQEKEIETSQDEAGSTDSPAPFSFCQLCFQKAYLKIKTEKLPDIKSLNQQNIKRLLEISEERKKKTNTSMSNLEAFNQIESQKIYLAKSLLTLEKKILSDAIFKINYAKKNKSIEVLMANKNFKFSLRMRDLLELDKLRENSLFKIAKSSFKCYQSFFSYNVF